MTHVIALDRAIEPGDIWAYYTVTSAHGYTLQ